MATRERDRARERERKEIVFFDAKKLVWCTNISDVFLFYGQGRSFVFHRSQRERDRKETNNENETETESTSFKRLKSLLTRNAKQRNWYVVPILASHGPLCPREEYNERRERPFDWLKNKSL